MNDMGEKILTKNLVRELGLDKASVITADMLKGYTSIGDYSFIDCNGLTSITIPNSVTGIGCYAFYGCRGLTSVDIPNSVMIVGEWAFACCSGLTSVTIPNSVTGIGGHAFYGCDGLTSVVIGNMEYKTQKVIDGKCKAYKAFNADMTCRYFQYEEGKTYEFDGEPKLCVCGFHACLNLAAVFNYYDGKIGENIVVHEVELEGVEKEYGNTPKVVANKITIGKRIL